MMITGSHKREEKTVLLVLLEAARNAIETIESFKVATDFTSKATHLGEFLYHFDLVMEREGF